jgi:hypothetical protein
LGVEEFWPEKKKVESENSLSIDMEEREKVEKNEVKNEVKSGGDGG